MTITPLKLDNLPPSFPKDEAISLELVEGIPIFGASQKVQNRIEDLLRKQKDTVLNEEEEQELNNYEDLDDYLSLVNRTIRNFYLQ
ncbi:hypothetical protein [Cyanothece sp. BG0011]|uniref:hypothetical protein n=1 Tax=Cyanothece sp. BG0011 TaxID=2082950 RepID=UPI000D1F1FB5|nr:hypothetical protein [Cyanothece sp. BG0011]